VFRFVDANTSRKVMQVMAKNANQSYGIFLTNTVQRPTPSPDAELRFLETPAGAPAAVKTWWYPHTTLGREFIYPKDQARRLAEQTNQAVLTTRAETVSDDQMQTAALVHVTPTGQETAVTDEQPVSAATTTPAGASPAPGTSNTGPSATPAPTSGTAAASIGGSDRPAQSGQTAAQAPAQGSSTQARTQLPRTSTALPLIGLLGLGSIVLVALRSAR
jgi:hypothetical protein